jgi:hypothetical protein
MLNSGKEIHTLRDKKINIITLVLSEKKFATFFPRTIILWNQLPMPVIAVPDLDAFKVAVKGVF